MNDLTTIIIQSRLLEARQHAHDYRLAVWTALAFAAGLACGLVLVWM